MIPSFRTTITSCWSLLADRFLTIACWTRIVSWWSLLVWLELIMMMITSCQVRINSRWSLHVELEFVLTKKAVKHCYTSFTFIREYEYSQNFSYFWAKNDRHETYANGHLLMSYTKLSKLVATNTQLTKLSLILHTLVVGIATCNLCGMIGNLVSQGIEATHF